MQNTDDISTIYFEDSETVRVEHISRDDYSVNETHLRYTYKNNALTIITEQGLKLNYKYDESSDCFTYSAKIKYCH